MGRISRKRSSSKNTPQDVDKRETTPLEKLRKTEDKLSEPFTDADIGLGELNSAALGIGDDIMKRGSMPVSKSKSRKGGKKSVSAADPPCEAEQEHVQGDMEMETEVSKPTEGGDSAPPVPSGGDNSDGKEEIISENQMVVETNQTDETRVGEIETAISQENETATKQLFADTAEKRPETADAINEDVVKSEIKQAEDASQNDCNDVKLSEGENESENAKKIETAPSAAVTSQESIKPVATGDAKTTPDTETQPNEKPETDENQPNEAEIQNMTEQAEGQTEPSCDAIVQSELETEVTKPADEPNLPEEPNKSTEASHVTEQPEIKESPEDNPIKSQDISEPVETVDTKKVQIEESLKDVNTDKESSNTDSPQATTIEQNSENSKFNMEEKFLINHQSLHSSQGENSNLIETDTSIEVTKMDQTDNLQTDDISTAKSDENFEQANKPVRIENESSNLKDTGMERESALSEKNAKETDAMDTQAFVPTEDLEPSQNTPGTNSSEGSQTWPGTHLSGVMAKTCSHVVTVVSPVSACPAEMLEDEDEDITDSQLCSVDWDTDTAGPSTSTASKPLRVVPPAPESCQPSLPADGTKVVQGLIKELTTLK